jgi:predicted PurR-regulated permease PerM
MPQKPVNPTTQLIFLGVLCAIAAALVWRIMEPFLPPVFFAVVLAIVCYPLYEKLLERLRRPGLAALVSVLLILALVLAPAIFIATQVVSEARHLYQSLARQSAAEGGWSEYLNSLVAGPVEWVASRTGIAVPHIQTLLVERAQWVSGKLVGWMGALAGNVTATISQTVICFITLFFLLRGGGRARAWVVQVAPMEKARIEELLHTAADAIIANVSGTLTVAAAQGFLVGLGFLFTGLPSPVLWGVCASFCSLIPLVGAAIVWAPGAIALAASGAWGKAIFLAVWGAGVVGMADNVIRPVLLAGRVQMNMLLILFSLLGGMQFFGLTGLIAGPVLFSVAFALFRIFGEVLEERAKLTSQADESPPG